MRRVMDQAVNSLRTHTAEGRIWIQAVVDTVALGQIFSYYFSFALSVSLHSCLEHCFVTKHRRYMKLGTENFVAFQQHT